MADESPVENVVLVRPMPRFGGAEFRYNALQQALDSRWRCIRIDVPCDRRSGCVPDCHSQRSSADPAQWWFIDRTYCPRFAEYLLRRLIELDPVAVICSNVEIYRYVGYLAERLSCPVVFDMHNVESPLSNAIHAMLPSGSASQDLTPDYLAQVARAEIAAVAAADELWVCSDDDRRLLLETYPATDPGQVRTVPNAVPVGPAPEQVAPQRLCFTGRLDYYPNVDAARVIIRDIAPLLIAMDHPLPVVVAGANPTDELLRLPMPSTVRVLGDPESTEAVIRGSIMLVPLACGGGSRLKVLEAFALGAPVVSTAKGVEGLGLEDSTHYLRAETPQEFAAEVRALLDDAALCRRLVVDAYALVAARFSVPALGGLLRREFLADADRSSALDGSRRT